MKNLTFQSLLFKGMGRFGEQPAITFVQTGETLTYKELYGKIDAVAVYLCRLGLGPGEKIVVLLPNSIEYVLFSLGAARCGATLTSLNEMSGAREVEFALDDLNPKVVVVGTKSQVQPVYQYAKNCNQKTSVIGVSGFEVDFPEEFTLFKWEDADVVSSLPSTDPDDIAMIIYTGGTTGNPKGIMHSQYGMAMNLIANCAENPFDDQDRVLLCTPLQHAAGLMLWRSLSGGSHVYISRTFDPEEFFKLVKEKGITSAQMVPTVIYRLIDLAKKKDCDVRSIRNINYGASPISPERLKEAFELFGPVMKQGYGVSECPNLITRLTKSDHVWAYNNSPNVLKSCGKPYMLVQVRLVDEKGNDVPTGQRGEITVKSPYLMVGYYKQPALTQEVLRDGWLHTGDIGEFDDFGFLHIVERKKDMIISGGMNVYSIEVENVVNQHPAIAISACIGIPHSDWGEAVCVFVTLKKGHSCTEEELISFCKQRTSKYMVPKEVKFLEAIPLTNIGKIDKKVLRKAFWEGRDRQIS